MEAVSKAIRELLKVNIKNALKKNLQQLKKPFRAKKQRVYEDAAYCSRRCSQCEQ